VGAVTKMILAGTLALGVIWPFDAFAHINSGELRLPFDILAKGRPVLSRHNLKAEPAFMVIAKYAAIGSAAANKEGLRVWNWRGHHSDSHDLPRFGDVPVRWGFQNFVWVDRVFGHVNPNAQIQGDRATNVFTSQGQYEKALSQVANFKFDLHSTALMSFAQNIRPARFMEGRIDQKDPKRAKSHPYQGCDSHYFCPPSRHFLRGKVLFYALVLTGGLFSLFYALLLVRSGKGAASISYQFFGIFGIMCGGIGCAMFIGITH
jgi:hypothetical protein